MKIKFSILLLVISSSAFAQNVLRVNNTPGVNVPYTTLAAAVAAAGPSDIIMVEGSQTFYGDITLTKKVTIVGPGYFLNENAGIQAYLYSAFIANLNFIAGSDGSTVSGMAIYGSISVQSANNITLSNCNITTGTSLVGSGTNLSFIGNYFGSNGGISGGGVYTNVFISSNFFSSQISLSGSGTAIITNNIFAFGNNSVPNCTLQNNIFLTGGTPLINTTTTVIQNNIFIVASVPDADASNIFNATTANLFLGTGTTDTQWKLKAGSAAIGAGVSNVDCGMYGGPIPYKASGIKAGQPTINAVLVPGVVPQNGVLNVKVSAKVN